MNRTLLVPIAMALAIFPAAYGQIADDVPALIKQLKNNDEAIRLKAAKALGKLGGKAKDAIPYLKEATKDVDEDVQAVAKKALQLIEAAVAAKSGGGKSDLFKKLAEDLRDPIPAKRIAAIGKLADLGAVMRDPASQALIEVLLEEKTKEVMIAGFDALEKINPKLYGPVSTYLLDESPEKRAIAIRKIGDMGRAGSPALPLLESAYKGYSQVSPQKQEVLSVMVKVAPEDQGVRDIILDGIKAKQSPRSSRSTNSTTDFRLACIKLAEESKIESKEVVPALIVALQNTIQGNFDELSAVLDALGKEGPNASDALPILKELKVSPNSQKRAAAGRTIDQILGKRGEPKKSVSEIRCFEGGGAGFIAFSPNGRTVISGGTDKIIHQWDVESGKEINRFKGHTDVVYEVSFTPDGLNIVSCSPDKTIRVWDVATAKELRRIVHNDPFHYYLKVTADGKRILSSIDGKSVYVWDLRSGKEIRHFNFRGNIKENTFVLDYSKDGRRVLTSGGDNALRLWDAEKGLMLRIIDKRSLHAVFSPDGRSVLAVGLDRYSRLYDVGSGNLIRRFEQNPSIVHKASFSPDGQHVLTGYDGENYGSLWDVQSGKEIRRFPEKPGGYGCIIFSPDGEYALSAGRDGNVRLWTLPE